MLFNLLKYHWHQVYWQQVYFLFLQQMAISWDLLVKLEFRFLNLIKLRLPISLKSKLRTLKGK
jgi:hypothetical protein